MGTDHRTGSDHRTGGDPRASTGRATHPSLPAPGTYRLDPGASRLVFSTRHLFGLAAVHGAFALTGGQVVLPADGGPGRALLEIAVDAASIDTASAARDRAVRAAGFLDVEHHPRITFEADELVATGSGWRSPGRLTARGATAPLELVVTGLTEDARGATVRASARVDRYAHGLTRAKGLSARYVDLDVTARMDRA